MQTKKSTRSSAFGELRWDKLRIALMRLSKDDLLNLLGTAFAALSRSQARRVFGGAVDLTAVYEPTGRRPGQLLDEIKRFHARSLSDHYYESFAVNSKNFTSMSQGTKEWIAEMNRLFGRCAEASQEGQHAEARPAFDLLFDLMSQVDECRDDIVFFAKEGGSWQVGVDFAKILPAYFTSLAAMTEPAEFARRVDELIRQHVHYNRDKYLHNARLAVGEERGQHGQALAALEQGAAPR